MYVDNKELTFGSLLDPRTNTVWRIDIQTFTPDWMEKELFYIPIAGGSGVDSAAPPGGLGFISLFVPTSRYTGISDFSFIQKAMSAPIDGTNPQNSWLTNANLHVEYNLAPHGFFEKPAHWTGQRATPGRIQQSISDIIKARNAAYEALYKADLAKRDLDWAISAFERKKASRQKVRGLDKRPAHRRSRPQCRQDGRGNC
jgi:hypothetical protein